MQQFNTTLYLPNDRTYINMLGASYIDYEMQWMLPERARVIPAG